MGNIRIDRDERSVDKCIVEVCDLIVIHAINRSNLQLLSAYA